jgi:hypothetical protein
MLAHGPIHGVKDIPFDARITNALAHVNTAIWERRDADAKKILDGLAVGRPNHQLLLADNEKPPEATGRDIWHVQGQNRTHRAVALGMAAYPGGLNEDFHWALKIMRQSHPYEGMWNHGMNILHYAGRPVTQDWNLPVSSAARAADKLKEIRESQSRMRKGLPPEILEGLTKAEAFFSDWAESKRPGSRSNHRKASFDAVTPGQWKRVIRAAAQTATPATPKKTVRKGTRAA